MTKNLHYSQDLEFAVLGACLIEKTAMGRTYGIITKDSFYYSDSQKVYGCMAEMFDQNIPIDCVTVVLRLEEKGIRLIGGADATVCRFTNSLTSSTHLEYHCYILQEMWKKREILKLTKSGPDESLSPKEQMAVINQRLLQLTTGEVKKDWYSMDELLLELIKHHDDLITGKKKMITTGFKALDKENGGFAAGQMIVIAARPSVGKSALMGKIALSQAMQKSVVGIISLEMDNVSIAARLTSIEADVEFWKIHRNLFDDENQRDRFYNIVNERTAHLPIYISDKTKVDINEIKAKAAKLKHRHGLDVLMIDYMQLVEASNPKNTMREQEVAKVSRGIKLMAMEMQIPVIVLCQLNRNSTTRKGKDRYPQLSDLRESGAIEQDADVVMMLHRDFMSGIPVSEAGYSTELEADLLVQKWRNGAMCHLELEWEPQKMKFKEKDSFYPITPVNYSEPQNEPDPF